MSLCVPVLHSYGSQDRREAFHSYGRDESMAAYPESMGFVVIMCYMPKICCSIGQLFFSHLWLGISSAKCCILMLASWVPEIVAVTYGTHLCVEGTWASAVASAG